MLLALATLVLLPGLLVVRAPWTAVPALSLAFWALSAWWPPLASLSRGRVSLAALLVFAPLLVLRFLPKHEVPPPPGTPARPSPCPAPRPGLPPPALLTPASVVVATAALALALPGLRWGNAPGPEGAFQTTAARLCLWRDAIPANLEPLVPLAPFGAHAPALATLGADLARLSGADPAPAVAAVVAAAAGVMLVGLFALHAVWAVPRVASLGAIVGLAVAPWPLWLSAWGAPDAVLALALLLPALALVAGHGSRSSAVAAGFLLAGGVLAQPLLAVGALAAGALLALRPVAAGALPSARPGVSLARDRRFVARRLALVSATALVLALPGLWPLAKALSLSESAGALHALAPADAAWFGAGLLAITFGPLAVAPLAARGPPARGRGRSRRRRPPRRACPRLDGRRAAVRRRPGRPGASGSRGAAVRSALRARGPARLGAGHRRAAGGRSRAVDPRGVPGGVGASRGAGVRAPRAVTSFHRDGRNQGPEQAY